MRTLLIRNCNVLHRRADRLVPDQLPDFHEVDPARNQIRATTVFQGMRVRLPGRYACGKRDVAEDPVELGRSQRRAFLAEEELA
jgi:hypothetical protein